MTRAVELKVIAARDYAEVIAGKAAVGAVRFDGHPGLGGERG
jgi:hypothetical protein